MDVPLKLVVFDLGGTVVDHGCMAPVVAIVETLRHVGISVSHQQARGPMGLHKRDHIREMLRDEEVCQQWQRIHGRAWSEDDVQQLYASLVPRQTEVALRHIDLIPGAVDCVTMLRDRQVALATTTGYPRSVAQPILDSIGQQGFQVDASICADEVPAGRPAPWMLFRGMEQLGVFPPAAVVKVGDTIPDMQAAKNAGTWAVGITETGSEFGLTSEELSMLPDDDRSRRHERASSRLRDAGADFVIRSPRELPEILGSFKR